MSQRIRSWTVRGALPVAAALLLSGCLDELVKSFVPVAEADGAVVFEDASVWEGGIPEQLTITAAKPDHGPFVGGTEVILSGTALSGELSITVGGKAVQEKQIKILSPVSVSIVTPAGEVGPADIEVRRGSEATKLVGGFRYDPIHVDPPSGPTVGGTLVTVQGRNTNFKQGLKLTLGGAAMTDVEVLSTTVLRGKTPPGPTGPADLVYSDQGSDRTVKGAFSYYASANPKEGGMGGGPIKGTVTVTVLNRLNRAPIEGATVVLEKSRQLVLKGSTDSSGAVAFSRKDLTGPVTVTASKASHESSTMVGFDARDLTIWLLPIASPQPGPLPPGTLAGRVEGVVMFGGTTGAGSKLWKLVPEPKTGQTKRVYVFSTVPSVAWGAPAPSGNGTIDFDPKQGATAWPFDLYVYPGALAIYAVAGLYSSATTSFQPYALGVTRGLVVGPGETLWADVWVNIPLTRKIKLVLDDAPKEVSRHSVTVAVDLGADGLIILDQWELEGSGVFPSTGVGRLPGFTHQGLVDATLTLDVLLESSAASGLPFVRAAERSLTPAGDVVTIDSWVGVPQQVKPTFGGALQGNTLAWSQSGAPHDLAVTVLQKPDETPVWRIMSPGAAKRVALPDPVTHGLIPWPKGELVWLQWLARLPDFDWNAFTYRHTSSSYWTRWSFDQLSLKVQ